MAALSRVEGRVRVADVVRVKVLGGFRILAGPVETERTIHRQRHGLQSRGRGRDIAQDKATLSTLDTRRKKTQGACGFLCSANVTERHHPCRLQQPIATRSSQRGHSDLAVAAEQQEGHGRCEPHREAVGADPVADVDTDGVTHVRGTHCQVPRNAQRHVDERPARPVHSNRAQPCGVTGSANRLSAGLLRSGRPTSGHCMRRRKGSQTARVARPMHIREGHRLQDHN